MPQPKWKFVDNLGDANPIDYGGYFIFEDETGVYPPEAEMLQAPNDDEGVWVIYRFSLDKCTFVNGILSDNKFHPKHPVWFAQPESKKAERPQDTTYLSRVADSTNATLEELQRMFCSDVVEERAAAYRSVAMYHGWENLDQYPLQIRGRSEIEKRYKDVLASIV